jgi:enamine deaminase RidA (YjgF/YER057c/UK114 family)
MTAHSRPAFALTNPPGLYDPRANGYSHVAALPADARLIFIAGQGGENSAGDLSPDFSSQARQAITNLSIALTSQGARLEQVFKLTLLIVDHDEHRLEIWTREAKAAWGEQGLPVCTLIPVPRLALDGMLIEIDAVAAC